MDKNIDLHIHTNMSDGVFSPKEIIDIAKENNVEYLSITDHDSVFAYNDELFEYAKNKGINLITGVEVSTKIDKCGIHVLGYDLDITNKDLNDMLFKIQNARHIYLKDVSEKLISLGYKINFEELDKIDIVTKAHISLDIIQNSENEELLLKDFGKIPSKGEFIEGIMNEGCKGYVTKYVPSLKEIREVIKAAGGKVVLAHPVAYVYIDDLNKQDIQNIVDELKPDGIESNYIIVLQDGTIVDDSREWNEFAKSNNLFITVGSDFHRYDEIHPNVGKICEDLKLNGLEKDEIIKNLLK